MDALYCVLNAAEGQLDILLASEEHMLTAQSWHAPTRGAEILTPALQSTLRIQKLTPAHITHFACVHGPGSFTGLRLTMGTVAAIRRITKAVNASIDYMQALALTACDALGANAQPNTQQGAQQQAQDITYTICVLTHARRQLVHAQWYTCTPENLPKAHGPAELISPQALLTQWQAYANQDQRLYVLGSGLERNAATFADAPPCVQVLRFAHPSPKALMTLAKEAEYHSQDLEPLYIRPCDAVENLDHIAQKQGMDAGKAHEKLAQLLTKPTTSDI